MVRLRCSRIGWSSVVLTCVAAASQKQGRSGAESVDEVRSHAERHCCITKKCLEGAESVGEARYPAV